MLRLNGEVVAQQHLGKHFGWSALSQKIYVHVPVADLNAALREGEKYRIVFRLFGPASALMPTFNQVSQPNWNSLLYQSLSHPDVLRTISLKLLSDRS